MKEQAHYKVLESRRDAAQHALTVAENGIAPALKAMLTARQQREAVQVDVRPQRLHQTHLPQRGRWHWW